MLSLFMLEMTESAQTASPLVWWLEIMKIALPILTTIGTTVGVGFWINRSSERYKNDLAKEIHRYQTLYPRRLKAIEELLAFIRGVEKEIGKALRIIHDEEFYLGNEEHRNKDLNPVNSKTWKLFENLKGKFDEVRVFLDINACDRITILINDLESARGMVVRIYVEATDESYIVAETPDGREKAEKLINEIIPEHIEELERIVRTSIEV